MNMKRFGQTELPSFNATTFDFDMNKNMAAHYLQ